MNTMSHPSFGCTENTKTVSTSPEVNCYHDLSSNANTATKSAYKETNILPDIDHDSLTSPEHVIEKYPKLLKASKIPTLAVKMAKEAYFGTEVMKHCTIKGSSGWHALPKNQLASMK